MLYFKTGHIDRSDIMIKKKNLIITHRLTIYFICIQLYQFTCLNSVLGIDGSLLAIPD